MVSYIKKHWVVLLSLFLAVSLAVYYYRGHAVGYLESNADIALGKPRYVAIGLPMYPDSMLARILKDQYSVRFERIANCDVTQYEVDFAETYNGVVDRWLARRYHRDIWLDIDNQFSELRRKHDTSYVR